MSASKSIVDEVITNKKGGDLPVLLNFQNGDLKAETSDGIKFTLAEDRTTKEKYAVVGVGNSVYRGPVKDESPAEVVNTFIAARNRKTNKVRLIQVQQATLQNSIYDRNTTAGKKSLDDDDARNLLIKNFGGRKSNRSFEKRLRMEVSVDVVKDQLDKTVQSKELGDEVEKPDFEENLSNIRPNLNTSAKRLEDVYSLYDIIPKELMNRLTEEADAVLAEKMDNLPITSELAKERIREIKLSSEPRSKWNLKMVKSMIYMDALCSLVTLREKTLQKSFSHITEKVENDIRKRFSQPGMDLRKTSYTRDKALCHYIVLALLTSPNYEVDMNIISQDLGISKSQIIKFAQCISAKQKEKSDQLTLALPGNMKPLRPVFTRRR